MISIQNLTKSFQSGRRTILAADHVSFDVGPGEVFGLLGPNGAGKTTMMRMILGLLKPDHGFAEIRGHRSDQQPDEVKRQVGFVSASAGVYQWLTAREMLSFFGEIYGLTTSEIEARIESLNDILRDRKKAIILCTHRLEQAQRVCTRFGLMHLGKKVLEGTLGFSSDATTPGVSMLTEAKTRINPNRFIIPCCLCTSVVENQTAISQPMKK